MSKEPSAMKKTNGYGDNLSGDQQSDSGKIYNANSMADSRGTDGIFKDGDLYPNCKNMKNPATTVGEKSSNKL